MAVDVADAADEAVGRRARDQLLARAAALLGGEDQRLVLDERAVVDEVGEILARRAPPLFAAARDGVRARRVEPQRVALANGGEVGTFGFEVDGRRLARRCDLLGASVEHREHLALGDRLADRHLDAAHDAVAVGNDLVLHLHRLEQHQHDARADRLVGPVGDRDHGARERGGDDGVGH